MSLPDFKFVRAGSLQHAIEVLANNAGGVARVHTTFAEANTHTSRGGVQIIAGGTDVVPSLQQKLFAPDVVLDIRGLRELRGIHEHPDGSITIGALTPLSEIEHSPVIARRCAVLHEAVKIVASPVIRNMATLGGNVCLDTRCLWYNQSLAWRKSCGFCIKKDGDLCHVAPGGERCWAVASGDSQPALLALDAELEIASAQDQSSNSSSPGAPALRRVPLCDFYTNLGDARLRLGRNELVTRIIIPAASTGWRGAYLKLRVRGSIDYPLAGVAVALKANGSIESARVAITAVNPAPQLVKGIDRVLVGKATSEITPELAAEIGDLAARTAKPLTTSALTPEYRREMVRVYAKRTLLAALER